MKYYLFIPLLLLFTLSSSGQNLVGLKPDEIREFMKKNNPDMFFSPVVNSSYSYFKYVDDSETRTYLFFLGRDSVCKSVKLICDRDMKKNLVKEYDTKFEKKGENSWIERHGKKNFRIEMKEEEWSCTVTIEPEM